MDDRAEDRRDEEISGDLQDDFEDDAQDEQAPLQHQRMSGLQSVAVIFLGAAMIFVGLATIFESHLFNPAFPAGAIFGPFALAGGALVVVLGFRGRR